MTYDIKHPDDVSQNLGDFTVEETVRFPYREAAAANDGGVLATRFNK